MKPETKPTTNNGEKAKRKIPLKVLLSSPKFYLALFPHIIILFLVLRNNLGYFYIFFIFYSELIIDYFVYIIGLLLTKGKKVQKIYKSKETKFDIITRALITGFVFIAFFGIFAFIVFYSTEDKNISVFDILKNSIFWLAIGIYLTTKAISLVINKYRYNTGQQPYVEKGISLMVNLVALIVFVIIFVVPSMFILPFLKLLQINVELIELVAIIMLFIIRAYVDGVLAFKEKDIEKVYH